MKCPNCGAKMQPESLYCERCGKDIHIVPDYDPQEEYRVPSPMPRQAEAGPMQSKAKSMQAKDRSMQSKAKSKAKSGVTASPNRKRRRLRGQKIDFILISSSVCLTGVLAAVMMGGMIYFLHGSYDYQMRRAVSCFAKGDLEGSARYYGRALELENGSLEAQSALADISFRLGDLEECKQRLSSLLQNPACGGELQKWAYEMLAGIYLDEEAYGELNDLLMGSTQEELLDAYGEYLASPPKFSYESGIYEGAVSLKLYSEAQGSIHYTLDGSDPDEESPLYTAPLLLTQDVVVKAVFLNEYGVESEVAQREYRFRADEDAP